MAAVIWWILGALWYSNALFGRPWMRAMGMESPPQGPGAAVYVVPLVAEFVAAVAIAMLARATGSTTIGEGIALGLVVGVGLVLTLYAVEATFGQRPQPGVWFGITGLYQLLGVLITAVLVTVWD